MTNTTDFLATVNEHPLTLRLIWPQWQGGGVESIRSFFSEVPLEEARRGYAVGAAVLNAVLPAYSGPTALVPVESGDLGLSKQDGIEAKEAVVTQLASALEVIGRYSPGRILTLGGECSVSVAPFSWLAERYGDDLAVLWIDSHPDVGTPASHYSGYHAMAVAVLTGHGDPDVLRLLPATLDPGRVALVGLHSWTEDDFPNIAHWGIRSFRPDELHRSSQPLLDWLKAPGCSRVAIHFDVDVYPASGHPTPAGVAQLPAHLTSRSRKICLRSQFYRNGYVQEVSTIVSVGVELTFRTVDKTCNEDDTTRQAESQDNEKGRNKMRS